MRYEEGPRHPTMSEKGIKPTNIYHVTVTLTHGDQLKMLVQAANAPLAGVEAGEIIKYRHLVPAGADVRRATRADLDAKDYDYVTPSIRDARGTNLNLVAHYQVPEGAVVEPTEADIPDILDASRYL